MERIKYSVEDKDHIKARIGQIPVASEEKTREGEPMVSSAHASFIS